MKPTGKRKILVVEDSVDMAILLKELLEGEDYELDIAANGQEALDLLQNADELPAVIFLDLMMPVMDGFEFRDRQRSDPKISGIPVVVMTADGNIQEKMAKIGANESIRKPMDLSVILRTASRYAS